MVDVWDFMSGSLIHQSLWPKIDWSSQRASARLNLCDHLFLLSFPMIAKGKKKTNKI